jgi:hypothetical protein
LNLFVYSCAKLFPEQGYPVIGQLSGCKLDLNYS